MSSLQIVKELEGHPKAEAMLAQEERLRIDSSKFNGTLFSREGGVASFSSFPYRNIPAVLAGIPEDLLRWDTGNCSYDIDFKSLSETQLNSLVSRAPLSLELRRVGEMSAARHHLVCGLYARKLSIMGTGDPRRYVLYVGDSKARNVQWKACPNGDYRKPLVSRCGYPRLHESCGEKRGVGLRRRLRKLLADCRIPRYGNHPGLRLLTLNIENQPSVDGCVDTLRDTLTRLKRSKFWKDRIRLFVESIEVTRNRDTMAWNVHVHYIIESEYIPHRTCFRLLRDGVSLPGCGRLLKHCKCEGQKFSELAWTFYKASKGAGYMADIRYLRGGYVCTACGAFALKSEVSSVPVCSSCGSHSMRRATKRMGAAHYATKYVYKPQLDLTDVEKAEVFKALKYRRFVNVGGDASYRRDWKSINAAAKIEARCCPKCNTFLEYYADYDALCMCEDSGLDAHPPPDYEVEE